MDQITPQHFADCMAAVSVRNVELGSGVDEPQQSIALHLSGGRTVLIEAELTENDVGEMNPTLKFVTEREETVLIDFDSPSSANGALASIPSSEWIERNT